MTCGATCGVTSGVGPSVPPAACRTSGLGRKVTVTKLPASNAGSGQSTALAPSRMRRMPVPAFSMKPMRCSKSATSGFRRMVFWPRSAKVMPFGNAPGLLTSMRSAYSSTKTLAASSMNQSRCITALVIASRSASIGYSGMFCRLKLSMRYAKRVLRSMKRMAPSMSATMPPSKSLRSRM